ncbi:hypothetical protein PHSY_001489 [Pseudozyma hubeiensis SY62]|uniref:Mak10-domain-containing protein n=1 Tax=Pseudozyma hubeiensis (strain SY62) TaxID=1305764 RepID=R9NYY5_PSEHS|nr:hypothetical protein PHSY_001489 [Pseudozyma hubeiensis SY62]GAC93921.1 hypothetical protein PHSY_001489 [Pseudozyma hubeiensis SY62]
MTTISPPSIATGEEALAASTKEPERQAVDHQRLITDAQASSTHAHATAAVPPRHDFHDATALLTSACDALRNGQMVAVPNFSLMDSMAAVKIMDARMDSGMELPASELPESDRLDTADSQVSLEDFDPFKPLTVPDVLWIMDRLLACEAAWHRGSALSQTLYTCLYFHAIKSLSHKHPRFQPLSAFRDGTGKIPAEASTSAAASTTSDHPPLQLVYKVLRAFLLGTVKTIDIAWSELASKQHLHDGEDFSSDKSGLSLLETTDTGYIVAELEDALEWLQSQSGRLPPSHVDALRARLGFRKQMLYAARLLQSPAEAAHLDVVMHAKFARRSWTLLLPMSDTADANGNTTSERGASSPGSSKEGASQVMPLRPADRIAAPSPASIAAFDPAYNRRLAWCQALRPISLPTAHDTWRILDGILEELQDVVRVLQHPDWLNWKSFFTLRAVRFQQSQPLAATPYVRSLFQTVICDRSMIATRLPLEWITEAFFQEVALVDPLLLRRASRIGRSNVEGGAQTMWNAPPPLGQRFHYFTQRVAGQLVQYLTALSQNRSRCKRVLSSKLYGEWVHISEEAGDIGRQLEANLLPGDRYLPDSLFAATQHLALEIMTQITLSGFELDLYTVGTDRETMWWLASRIQVEQSIVCSDLRVELSKLLERLLPEHRPRRYARTILYLSRQILLAQALEQLAVSTIFLVQLSDQTRRTQQGAEQLWQALCPGQSDCSVEMEAAVFSTRIKWMRSNVRRQLEDDEASIDKDPGETLWQEFLDFRAELQATDEDTLAAVAGDRLDQAIAHLQQLSESLSDEHQYELGAVAFSGMVAILLATARHNRKSLATTLSAGHDPKQRERGAQHEWIFEHPWIPKWTPPERKSA